MNPQQMEMKILRLLDGEPGEEEWRETHALLETSEEARRIYCAHARLSAMLGQMPRERVSLAANALSVKQALAMEWRRNFRVAFGAAAAVILLLLVSLQWVIFRSEAVLAQVRASPGAKFAITHQKESRGTGDGSLVEGTRVDLKQGVLEMRFATGARAVVRAPATVEILDKSSIRLDQGIAWIRVEPEAKGFQVVTPRAVITDLGTEFGVVSEGRGRDSVHVFSGRVSLQMREDLAEAIELKEGEARQWKTDGTVTTIHPRPEWFFQDLPTGIPWIGWSFDDEFGKAEGTMPEAANTRAKPQPGATSVGIVPGRFGTALATNGPVGWWESDWPGLAGFVPRSLSFWVRLSPGARYLHPLAGWGRRSSDDYAKELEAFFAFAESLPDGRTVAGASLGGYWIKGKTMIADGEWHHVVISSDGGSWPDGRPDLRLYVDGRWEDVSVHHSPALDISPNLPRRPQTRISGKDARPLSIFANLKPGDEPAHGLTVAMDEVRVFEAALESEQVRSLFETNALLPDAPQPGGQAQSP